jgi:hypothetical protein
VYGDGLEPENILKRDISGLGSSIGYGFDREFMSVRDLEVGCVGATITKYCVDLSSLDTPIGIKV